MSKNVVICSDGTGNSFRRRISNVARTVKLLALDDPTRQTAVYDQGIGTDARRWKDIDAFRTTVGAGALEALPGPHESWCPPLEWYRLVRGLAFGDGLEVNVRQMYRALAVRLARGDRVFLFGFSRGAFTVRTLAGLLYRCGLPAPDRAADIDRLFDRAWQLYLPMRPDKSATHRFREGERQRECPIHFLGVWDTVKSYGGVRPVLLPHLRHNPIVRTVRHALALDERRGWFDVTTWGRLDLDQEPHAAMSRLTEDERQRILQQDIEEVWFRGSHADVGGGHPEAATAGIALRWMLGEAAREGLALNRDGQELLASPDPEPRVHDSHSCFWRAVERLPRREINNLGEWPTSEPACRRDAPRHPGSLRRNGMVSLHESVASDGASVRIVCTRPLRRGPGAGAPASL